MVRQIAVICFFFYFGNHWLNSCAQESSSVEVLNTNELVFEKIGNSTIRKMIGNVILKQDSTLLYCDSAYHNTDSKIINAFGHVKIEVPGQVAITCKQLTYLVAERRADMHKDVSLTDGQTTLKTEHLIYLRGSQTAFYTTGGTLTNSDGLMKSQFGNYNTATKIATFARKVELNNPDMHLISDSLVYETTPQTILFVSPTTIKNSENQEIKTNKGRYFRKDKKLWLYQRSTVSNEDYILTGDTLFFDDSLGTGFGRCNVVSWKKDSSGYIAGDKLVFKKQNKQALYTENPWMWMQMESDTMMLVSDTLEVWNDSLNHKEYIHGWPHCQFVMTDLQGKSDSISDMTKDSLLRLYHKPVIWSAENQLTGDTISIWVKNKQPDSLFVSENTFLISQVDSIGFNQIKSRWLHGKFINNQIVWLRFIGNAESIYFSRDKNEVLGMNQSKSAGIFITLVNNKPSRIQFYKKPEAIFYPYFEVIDKLNRLDGFSWRLKERPTRWFP